MDAYVGFEIAKLLKENGFNEECEYCYAYFDDNDVRVFELRPNKNAQNLTENRYPFVTQQCAMAWLRKGKNIFIEMKRDNQYYLGMPVIPMTKEDKERGHKPLYYANVLNEKANFISTEKKKSYEEAVEEALKIALKNEMYL